MNWDWLISIAVIVILSLAVWAKISQQTIVELLRDIKDFISESRQNVAERGMETVKVYE